jgi:hypothetical protein
MVAGPVAVKDLCGRTRTTICQFTYCLSQARVSFEVDTRAAHLDISRAKEGAIQRPSMRVHCQRAALSKMGRQLRLGGFLVPVATLESQSIRTGSHSYCCSYFLFRGERYLVSREITCEDLTLSWGKFWCIQLFLCPLVHILRTFEGQAPSLLWRCVDASYPTDRYIDRM